MEILSAQFETTSPKESYISLERLSGIYLFTISTSVHFLAPQFWRIQLSQSKETELTY